MNILIVGCGDTGSQLANVLDHMGNQVSVVDRNPETAAELSDSFTGMFTVGVPIDQDVLRHAGIEEMCIRDRLYPADRRRSYRLPTIH